MAKDPVCGMEVNEQDARSKGLTSDHKGQSYYFCSQNCKQQFDRSPEQYANQPAPAQRP